MAHIISHYYYINLHMVQKLLQHLYLSFGLCGTPFHRIKSYLSLTDRTQMVVRGNTRINWVSINLLRLAGVGPSTYLIYSFHSVLAKLQAMRNLYADDVQAPVHSSEQIQPVERLLSQDLL